MKSSYWRRYCLTALIVASIPFTACDDSADGNRPIDGEEPTPFAETIAYLPVMTFLENIDVADDGALLIIGESGQ